MSAGASSCESAQGMDDRKRKRSLIDTAVVFDSVKDPSHCGHALDLRGIVRSIQQSGSLKSGSSASSASANAAGSCCPVCSRPIVLIRDGIIAAMYDDDNDVDGDGTTTAADGDTKREKHETTTTIKNENRIIRFKFGKQFFELAVLDQKTITQERRSSSGGGGSMNSWMLGWWWIPAILTTREGTRMEDQMTAQGRISYVLNMSLKKSGMKILNKGKIIYPASTLTDFETSNLLIQHSSTTTGDSASSSSKYNLMVVGTMVGDELLSPSSNSSSWFSSLLLSTLSCTHKIVMMTWTIVFSMLDVAIKGVRTMVGLFLPSSTTSTHAD